MLQDAIKTYVAVVWLVIELSTMGGGSFFYSVYLYSWYLCNNQNV